MATHQALKDAALLRQRVLGCLKAAPAPMTLSELATWPSIAEQAPGQRGYGRVVKQIKNLLTRGEIERIGMAHSSSSTYRYVEEKVIAAPITPIKELSLQIDREHKALRFIFEGVTIKIEVL